MIFRSLKLIFLNFKCLPIIFIYIFFYFKIINFLQKNLFTIKSKSEIIYCNSFIFKKIV